MIVTSKIYPNKSVNVKLLLYGIEISDLKTFTKIIKTDKELCLEEFKAYFKFGEDGYSEEDVIDAYNTVEPLESEDVFSEEFSNVEVRAAIIKYVSPDVILKSLKHEVIDKSTMEKTYPRIKIKGKYGKPDNSNITEEDIEIEYVKRTEEYELIEITDRKLIQFLPWGRRESVIVLRMKCPSSHKDYYEYIDGRALITSREVLDEERSLSSWIFNPKKKINKTRISLKNTGELILQSVAWQMRKSNEQHLTRDEYLNLKSET